MFSPGEIVIILVVAFLVFGPEKFPELARTMGKWVLEMRKGMHNVTAELNSEFNNMQKKQPPEIHPEEEKPKDSGPNSDK